MTLPRGARRNLILAALVAAAAGAFLFHHLIGFHLVSAHAPFWVAPPNDMATMMTGALAVLQSPWTFPFTVTHRLDTSAISIVYTDSIPWLVLSLKALGLGRLLNPFGLYLLASYLLQPVAMIVLSRTLGVKRAGTLLAAGLLALLYPAWLMRHGHVALTGHWIILFALALSVACARDGLSPRRIAAFVGLGVLATGVHAYFLPTIAVCFGAALLSELLQRRPRAVVNVAAAAGLMLVAIGLSAWVLGYGTGQGITDGVQSLGFYSMNLAGPVLPQASAIFGQTWTGGWFTQTIDPNGGQWFEGFNYLGAGILFAIGAGAALSLRHSWIDIAPADWTRRYLPLAAGLAVLAAAAVGPVAYLGLHKIYDLPRSSGVFDWLGLFRAHGRFFWPVGYMVLALALSRIDRLATMRTAAAILLLALGLQVIDSRGMRQAVHATFERPSPAYHPAALADAAVIRGRAWVFSPTFDCASDPIDRQEISKLSLIAVRAGGTSNATATARSRGGACQAQPDLYKTAMPGDRRIVVILGSQGSFSAYAARKDCERFLRGIICGADLDKVPGLRPVTSDELLGAPGAVDKTIPFDQGASAPELTSGWAAADPHGTWSNSTAPVMTIDLPATLAGKDITLELDAMSYAAPPAEEQAVDVLANGEKIATWHVEKANWRTYRALVPARLIKAGQPLKVTYLIPGAPLPTPPETRRLGLGLKQLSLGH